MPNLISPVEAFVGTSKDLKLLSYSGARPLSRRPPRVELQARMYDLYVRKVCCYPPASCRYLGPSAVVVVKYLGHMYVPSISRRRLASLTYCSAFRLDDGPNFT